MTIYHFGFDYGNSDAAGTIYEYDGQSRSLAIPSVTAEGTLSGLEHIRSASGTRDGALGEQDYVLEYKNSELYVGHLALTQSSDPHETRGDINRYWSTSSLESLLTLAGSLIFDREFALNIVTGLPAETYSAANRRRVIDALEGEHPFKLNGESRVAHVSVARVIQEGAGGIVLYGTKQPVKQCIVDIGGRTTDLFTSRGQEPIRDLCRGFDKGVEYAADLLSNQVFAAYNRRLTLDERKAILRAHVAPGIRHYPDIPISGQSMPADQLYEWTESALRRTGKLICSFVSKVLKNNEQGGVATDLKSAYVIGGGAYYFLRDIQGMIPFVQMREHPEFVNSLSYARFAKRFSEQAPVHSRVTV